MKFKEHHKTLNIREQKHFITALKGKRSGIAQATVDQKHIVDIEFTSTPCNFGGRRYWFVCQECGGNRLLLREHQHRLLCNSCISAPYKTASITKSKRAAVKRVNLLRKLNLEDCDGVVLPEQMVKPKGMWQKTYLKIRAEYHALLKQDAIRINATCATAGLEPFYDGDDLREIGG